MWAALRATLRIPLNRFRWQSSVRQVWQIGVAALPMVGLMSICAGGHFGAVTLYDGRGSADYILSGRLEKLDELDYGGGVQVAIAVSAEVSELQSGRVVWSNAAADTAFVEQRSVPAIVSKMSNVTEQAIEKLLQGLALPTLSK
jgi:hypothetical protein